MSSGGWRGVAVALSLPAAPGPSWGRVGLRRGEGVALLVLSLVLHGLLWWLWQRQPPVERVPVPKPQREVMVSLVNPAPPPVVAEPSVPAPPPTEPPRTEPEAPVEDAQAIKPAEVAPVPAPKPTPEPERAVLKPPPEPSPPPPKPSPKAPSRPSPAPPSPTPGPATRAPGTSSPGAAAAPVEAAALAAPSETPITPAVSDLRSLGNPPPRYPSRALRRGYEGDVQLRILVLPNGTAGQVEVMRSSGHAELDQAAVTTVRTWRFQPARRGDTPIPGYALQTIAFRLPR